MAASRTAAPTYHKTHGNNGANSEKRVPTISIRVPTYHNNGSKNGDVGTNTDSAGFPMMTLNCYTDLSCSDAARIHVCPKPVAQWTALGSIPLARSTAPGAACKTRHDTALAGRRRVPHNVHVGLRIRSVRALLRLCPVGRQGVVITVLGVPRWV
jgi:hypothetical protein